MKLKCTDGIVRDFLVVHEGTTGFSEEAECLGCGEKFGFHDTYILKPLFKKHICPAATGAGTKGD